QLPDAANRWLFLRRQNREKCRRFIPLMTNILRRHGIRPVPERSKTTTWKEFIRRHTDVLAGTDFFTVEVLTWRGLVTYYVLFFIHLDSRRVSLAGVTDHADACWMSQAARNATFEDSGI